MNAPAWSERDKLINEKQALGFYFSGHPFSSYEKEVRQIVKTALKDIAPNTMVLLAGILHESRVKNGKRGKMCVLSLDDATARIEVLLYSEVFDKRRGLLKEDSLVIVRGKVTHDEFSGGNRVAAEDVYDLDTARRMFAREIRLSINGNGTKADLDRCLRPYLTTEGGCTVWIDGIVATPECTAEYKAKLGPEWKVRPEAAMLEGLRAWLGESGAQVIYDLSGAQATLAPRNWGGQRGQFASSGADDY